MRFKDKFELSAVLLSALVSMISNVALAEIEYGGSVRLSDLFIKSESLVPITGENESYLNVTDLNLRLIAEGAFTETLSAELHAVGDLSFESTNNQNLVYAVTDTSRINRLFSGATEWNDEGGWAGQLGIDRMNVRWFLPWADITVGRQAITLGTAYFWNPLDVFRPYDATTFDRDYKTGVDALRLDVALSDFWSTTLIYSAGRDGSMEPGKSHSLARIYGSARGFDLTAQVSYEHRDPSPLTTAYVGHDYDVTPIDDYYSLLQLGGGISGELGSIPIRLELVLLSLEQSSANPLTLPSAGFAGSRESYLDTNSTTLVVGTGYRFSNDFSLELEHLHSGILDTTSLNVGYSLQSIGITRQASPHVSAVLLNYLVHPLVQASLATLFDWNGTSALLQANVTSSISDEIELLLSGIMPIDFESPSQPGEFDTYPTTLFVQAKGYF